MLRLLLIGNGGGSGYTPATETLRTISSAPNGGWTGIPDPKAIGNGLGTTGTLFLGWVDGTSGSNEYAQFDEATDTLSTPVALGVGLLDDGPPDNHNSGSIMRRSSDSKLVAAYCGHYDTRVRVRVSTNANDATAWGSEQVLNPGYAGVYTYCTLVQLDSGTVYLFARNIPNLGAETGRLIYATSSDGGATWGSWTVLMTGASLKVPYWRIGTNGARIDVLTTDRAPAVGDPSGLYHFHFDGTTPYTTDGTPLSVGFEPTSATLVQASATGQPAFPFGVSYQSGGDPAGVLCVSLSGSDTSVRSARWTGSAWTVTQVTTAGGIVTGNILASGASIDHALANTIYASRKISGKFEVFRYRTADGTTWTSEQLTSGSSVDNIWSEAVNDPGRVKVIWLHGTYTSDTNYSFGVRGYG